ncbi:STAS domain-containing protein [Streptomyces sp. NPDC055808]
MRWGARGGVGGWVGSGRDSAAVSPAAPVGKSVVPAPRVETIASSRCLVARVGGDMDYVTAPVFRPRLRELLSRGERFVVLDLSRVQFCDSVGLDMLLDVWRRADGIGTVLVLACVPQALRQIFQVTGADELLRVYDTVTAAEAAMGV